MRTELAPYKHACTLVSVGLARPVGAEVRHVEYVVRLLVGPAHTCVLLPAVFARALAHLVHPCVSAVHH
jgi:hypothetical protein